MKILYFAWLKARTGLGEEDVEPPDHVTDVQGLIDWLKGRSPGHAQALKDLSAVRVAVNQEYAAFDHGVEKGDEIALFPPVTGG